MTLVEEAWMSQTVAVEPWDQDATLFKPLEEQVLIGENASALAVQAYLQMCGLKTKVVTVSNAESMSPSGKIPILQCGNFVISEPSPIMSFVKQKGTSLNPDLTVRNKQDLQAYTDLINNVLIPAELFVTWRHEETVKKITNKRYGYPYPWPLNDILCWKKRMEVLSYLNILGWGESRCSITKAEEEVKRCCLALSQKLESKPYFFGDRPSELDALVFGHLFTILTTKLPDNRLAETVKTFDNLVQFCKRIDEQFFCKDLNISDVKSSCSAGDMS